MKHFLLSSYLIAVVCLLIGVAVSCSASAPASGTYQMNREQVNRGGIGERPLYRYENKEAACYVHLDGISCFPKGVTK